jgi:SagB-type dehydrogenase family enzyme
VIRCTLQETRHLSHVMRLGMVFSHATAAPPLVVTLPDPPRGLPQDFVPVLALGSRVYVDEDGALVIRNERVSVEVETWNGGSTCCRTERALVLAGDVSAAWTALRRMDGRTTMAALCCASQDAGSVVALLHAHGLAENASRQVARFVHNATKKAWYPTGGLTTGEVLALTRAEAQSGEPDRLGELDEAHCPPQLLPFHRLTGARRSPWIFGGAITRTELMWLLATGAGETTPIGPATEPRSRRAYASSGGLYAILLDVVAINVAGLDAGLYRYRARGNELTPVRHDLHLDDLLAVALPGQHASLQGAAALVCMSADFIRHERKYGVGGYRMLAAEAGHISQNLLLAATAMGLVARPCGGFFDDPMTRLLARTGETEPFILSVMIGREAQPCPEPLSR